jgi:hypothetical protein
VKIYAECKIDLPPGELIVSATSHRDYIIVITDRGSIFKVFPEEQL